MVILSNLDQNEIEFNFYSKNDKSNALIMLRRYIIEFKNISNGNKNFEIFEKKIRFNKNCQIKAPILKFSDFYDKNDRFNNKGFDLS